MTLFYGLRVDKEAAQRGKSGFIAGLRPRVRTALERLGVTKLLPPDRLQDSRLAALEAAAALVVGADGR